MRRWLSRLSFSFFIVALLLIWQVYKSMTGRAAPLEQWRLALYLIAAVLAVVMGALGVRARHQRSDEEDQENPDASI